MFGFLRPDREAMPYRSIYARCCQHLRHHFGIAALPFHSYEAVFLFACAADAGHVPVELVRDQQCCRLRRDRNLGRSPDALLGQFVGAVTLTLADIKLADDAADRGSLAARAYRRFLRPKVRQAQRVLARADPNINDRIAGWLNRHAALEGRRELIPMNEYSAPTASAFAHVFGLAGHFVGSPEFGRRVCEIFQHVGAALISFDCAADWWEDRDTGSYNPLADSADIPATYGFAADHLDAALALCRDGFGAGALSVSLLTSVADRVHSLAARPALPPTDLATACVATSGRMWRHAGLELLRRTKPSRLYADCGGGGGFGACLAIVCCAAAAQSACKEEKQENTGCGAQNERTDCCGCKDQTTKIAGPCEVSNQGTANCCGNLFCKAACK